MFMDDNKKFMESICLKHDNGADLQFRGRLFSESSWFDNENDILTKQKLYLTEENEQVYYIVRIQNSERTRSVYKLSIDNNQCTMANGISKMTLEIDMLMLAVRQLCGLNDETSKSLSMVEEVLKVANI